MRCLIMVYNVLAGAGKKKRKAAETAAQGLAAAKPRNSGAADRQAALLSLAAD